MALPPTSVIILFFAVGWVNCGTLSPSSCPSTTSCTALSECQLITDLMDKTCLQVGRLQELTCGYLRSEIMVCCPTGGRVSPFRAGHNGAPAQFFGVSDNGLNSRSCGRPQVTTWANPGFGAHPWVVQIGFKRETGDLLYGCAGSLITPTAVLTTAGCAAVNPPGRSISVVKVGEYYLEDDPDCEGTECAARVQVIPVQSVIIHPEYDISSLNVNNIAIVVLKAAATLSLGAQLICLQDKVSPSLVNTRATIIGFGSLHNNDTYHTEQQQVNVPIRDPALCGQIYDQPVGEIEKQLCVGGEAGKAACDGFGGSPVVILEPVRRDRYIQVAMVSSQHPTKCGEDGVPNTYIRVQEYFSWIENNLP